MDALAKMAGVVDELQQLQFSGCSIGRQDQAIIHISEAECQASDLSIIFFSIYCIANGRHETRRFFAGQAEYRIVAERYGTGFGFECQPFDGHELNGRVGHGKSGRQALFFVNGALADLSFYIENPDIDAQIDIQFVRSAELKAS